LVDVPLNENSPVPALHWIVTDKTGESIVVEKTREKLGVFDNPVKVMTNQPTFDWHLMNLNKCLYITCYQPEPVKWSDMELNIHGVGAGTFGLPGDSHSISRFVRIAYARYHIPVLENDLSAVTQCLHLLDYVKMVKSGVITDEMEEKTTYSVCMDQENGIFYYKTYGNNRLNAVSM
jgi:choloylglycine hydrolase